MMTINVSPQSYAPTYDNVIAALLLIAPQFNEIDSDTLQQYYELVYPRISYASFGSQYVIAYANMMAHYMSLALDPYYNSAGTISKKQIGDQSVSFNNTNKGASLLGFSNYAVDQDFCRTKYGITYLSILASAILPATVSNRSLYMGGIRVPLPPPPYYGGYYGIGIGGYY